MPWARPNSSTGRLNKKKEKVATMTSIFPIVKNKWFDIKAITVSFPRGFVKEKIGNHDFVTIFGDTLRADAPDREGILQGWLDRDRIWGQAHCPDEATGRNINQ